MPERGRKPRKITVLPSVGKPDAELAARALVPLLLDYIRPLKKPAAKWRRRRRG